MENNQKELILLKDLGMLFLNEDSKHKRRYSLCRCFCGKEFKARTDAIKSGNTKSCGCNREDRLRQSITKHGLYGSRLYKLYYGMKQRCYNENNHKYKEYGLRGIAICDEWLNDFMSFYNWSINNGYKDNLTIDRENNNLGYAPSNCRWTTKTVQQRNTRKIMSTNASGYRGVGLNKQKNNFSAQIHINNKKIYLGTFNTAIDGAKAYDNYIIKHNLEHTKNF